MCLGSRAFWREALPLVAKAAVGLRIIIAIRRTSRASYPSVRKRRGWRGHASRRGWGRRGYAVIDIHVHLSCNTSNQLLATHCMPQKGFCHSLQVAKQISPKGKRALGIQQPATSRTSHMCRCPDSKQSRQCMTSHTLMSKTLLAETAGTMRRPYSQYIA